MNPQWRRHRMPGLRAVSFVTLALLGGVACSGKSTNTSSEERLSANAAYEMVLEKTQADPALKEPIPRDSFEAIARTMCEELEVGSPDKLLATISETPTQSGERLRPESVREIASAGVRAYCPDHASKLQ